MSKENTDISMKKENLSKASSSSKKTKKEVDSKSPVTKKSDKSDKDSKSTITKSKISKPKKEISAVKQIISGERTLADEEFQRKPNKLKIEVTKEVEEGVIGNLCGSDVFPLVEYLRGKKDTSEFIIAKDIEQDIQSIRNQLYRLLNHNLVTFWRKKDKQKGWYIYYWTYNPSHIEFLFWDIKKKKLQKLKERLSREEGEFFFMCQDNGCVRLDFDKVTEFNYQCPECGGMMMQQDNSRTKDNIKIQISELEEELSKAGRL